MNLLYLCDEYPPGQHGGIGTAVKLLAREMVNQGHKVVVAGIYPLGYGGDDDFDDEGVRVYRFRMGLDSKFFNATGSLAVRIIKRLLKDTGLLERGIKKSLATYQKQLERIIAEHQIDLIEMPDYNDHIKYCKSFVAFPKLPVPVIVKMHGCMTHLAREAGKTVPLSVFKMEQHILNQATALSSVSRYTADQNGAHFSYPHAIEVIHNGINADVQTGTVIRKPKQVIYTGSLTSQKGIYQLAKAWNLVTESIPDAQLLILGRGRQQKVRSYFTPVANDTVVFGGYVKTDELYGHLAASMVAVFPSYSEAFALAPLEAMVCGTAVINTNKASGPELIDDGVNGLLIDPDDIDQLASAIIHLLNHVELCKQLAENGNKTVRQKFSINKIALQNVAFYNRVLQKVI